MLREIDAELAAELERLAKASSDIAVILRDGAPADADPISAEIDALRPDADEVTRQILAEKLAPPLARYLTDHPWLKDPARDLADDTRVTRQTLADTVIALYNAAQLDVLSRAGALAEQQLSQPRDAAVVPDR